MSRKKTNQVSGTAGFGLILLGAVMIFSPLFMPLSITGWFGRDVSYVFVVYSQVASNQEDFRAEGALVLIQKTDVSQADPVNVWGSPPPTETDQYGFMTFYGSTGIHYWKVEWNGMMVDGYVQGESEGDEVITLIFMNEGYAKYIPESAESTGEAPIPPEEPIVDVIVVVVDSSPIDGRATAFHGDTGQVLGTGDLPLQFTHEGQFPLRVVFEAVEGYETPPQYEEVVTSDRRITGIYTEEGQETIEPTGEPLETTEVEATSEEEESYDVTTIDEPDPSGAKASAWEQRLKLIRSFKSPILMALQVGGALFVFIGVVMIGNPLVSKTRSY
jgi:hypothetical protein